MREAFDNRSQTAFIQAYYADLERKKQAELRGERNLGDAQSPAGAGFPAFTASARLKRAQNTAAFNGDTRGNFDVAAAGTGAASASSRAAGVGDRRSADNKRAAGKSRLANFHKLSRLKSNLSLTVDSLKQAQKVEKSEFKDGLNDVEQPILQAEAVRREQRRTDAKLKQQRRSQLRKQAKDKLVNVKSGGRMLGRLFKNEGTAADLRLNLQGEALLLKQRNMHLGILMLIISMLVFGLIMIFSTSMNIGMFSRQNPYYFINRQYIATLLGLFVMFLVANIDIRFFNKPFFALLYYLGTQVLLLLVLIPQIGTYYNGQRRWLEIPFTGSTTFQPSEIAKVGVPFLLGFYFTIVSDFRSRGDFNLRSPWLQRWFDGFIDIALPTGIILSWCLPISMQSHMSAVFIMLILTFVLFLAMRLPWRSWLYGGTELAALGLALILAVLIMRPLLPENFTRRWDHLAKRIQIFMVQNDTEEDKAEVDVDTYHSDQAFIAIAGGGLTGTGLGQGKQKLNYLPEGHNDYIFSNIVEELGFVGGVGVLSLFILFFFVGCSVVTRTRDIFSRLLSLGYVFLLTIQGVLSIAVNVGVVPPTGISLPFFSFGGTSNLFFLFAAGCILSISKFAVQPSLALRNRIKMTKEQLKQKYRDQGVKVR